MTDSAFQQSNIDTARRMDVTHSRRRDVQDLTAQSRRTADVFALVLRSHSRYAGQMSLLDQSSPGRQLLYYRFKNQQFAHTPHTPPLADVVRQLVEGERISAARALLAREASSIVRSGDLAIWAKVLAEPRTSPAAEAEGCDRTAEYEWLTKYEHQYRGNWVAIAGSNLLAHGPTLRDVLAALEAQALGKTKALVHKIR